MNAQMIDQHYWSLTPIRKAMFMGDFHVLPYIGPSRALEWLSFVFKDEGLPGDDAYFSVSITEECATLAGLSISVSPCFASSNFRFCTPSIAVAATPSSSACGPRRIAARSRGAWAANFAPILLLSPSQKVPETNPSTLVDHPPWSPYPLPGRANVKRGGHPTRAARPTG